MLLVKNLHFAIYHMKVVELKMFLMYVHDDENLSNYLLTLESALVKKDKVLWL